jgi:hypothetical protein
MQEPCCPPLGALQVFRDVANNGGADSFMALPRPMHDGQGNLGVLWEF